MIDLRGLDKAEVLAALFNASRPIGMGLLQPKRGPMTREEAAEILADTDYIDYCFGRPLKVGLKADTLDERLYDMNHGAGAAAYVIEPLRTGAKK